MSTVNIYMDSIIKSLNLPEASPKGLVSVSHDSPQVALPPKAESEGGV